MDLETMGIAKNYYRWIYELFKPYLGSRIVEVGAGTGYFSKLLLDSKPESLFLIEPSQAMYEILTAQVKQLDISVRVDTYNATFREISKQIKSMQQPDSIIYINVMEHIPEDEAELSAVHQTLDKGGRVFIFVPALRWLYGDFDRRVGHCRRYTKPELEDKCRRAGFKILRANYFDLIGIIPWWLIYCVLKSTRTGGRAAGIYDRFVVPIEKKLELIAPPLIGKNLILVGEKS
jgi:SAM-dependent methyltransferase